MTRINAAQAERAGSAILAATGSHSDVRPAPSTNKLPVKLKIICIDVWIVYRSKTAAKNLAITRHLINYPPTKGRIYSQWQQVLENKRSQEKKRMERQILINCEKMVQTQYAQGLKNRPIFGCIAHIELHR